MTEVDDILNDALEGAALKTRDILNLPFTLHSTGDLLTHTFEDGKTSQSYRGVIQLDGDAESQDAWLGGAYLTPQITALREHGRMPAYLKVIMDSTRKGNPYILVSAGDQPAPSENGTTVTTSTNTPLVKQGSVTVQQKAVEAFMAARTAKSEDELTELLIGLNIDFAYDSSGFLVVTEEALTTQTALALKKSLA